MIYEQTKDLLSKIKKLRTADVDKIAYQYLEDEVDVSALYPHIKESGAIHRIYFVVSLQSIKTLEYKLQFIEDHFSDLNDWWHVDLFPQLLRKGPKFDFVYQKAKKYCKSPLLFARRWGYVIFLTGWQKDPSNTKKILSLFHDDDEYYVQMGEAWLLADLTIYNPEECLEYIASKPLKYNIIGKAIQKICDSFRIPDDVKNKVKELRKLYK